MTDEIQQNAIIREARRAELGQTEFGSGAQGGALMQPRNGRELLDMANMMATSGQMIRDFYRDNPGDCAALIMICQPYGFNPFQVSWKTYKASKNADAPVSFEGQLVNAMVNMSAPIRGRLKYAYEGDIGKRTRSCTVTGIDREDGSEITYTTPKLSDIKIQNSPLWESDPDQQLGYYAARAWARRHFPEMLLGVYTREEIEEAPTRDITPQPGRFAQMADKARGASQNTAEDPPQSEVELEGVNLNDAPEDAEIIPDENPAPDNEEPFTPDPFSEKYAEGSEAHKNNKGTNSCPYSPGEDMLNWLAGYNFEEMKGYSDE